MIEIPLTQGFTAIVDDADAWVLNYKWCALKVPGNVYAKRTKRVGPRCEGKTVTILLHRELLTVGGEQEVDHRNGNGLDNRRKNLRRASKSLNAANRKKFAVATSSRFKGVSWFKRERKWVARITVDGVTRSLGHFKNERDAARAYNSAARSAWGKFAVLNDA